MKKNSEATIVTSLNGRQKISAQEFDQLFDDGSDKIDDFIDLKQAEPGLMIKPGEKVTVQTLLNGKFFSKKIHLMRTAKEKKVNPISAVNKIKKQISLSPEAFVHIQKFAKSHHLNFSSAIEAAVLQLD